MQANLKQAFVYELFGYKSEGLASAFMKITYPHGDRMRISNNGNTVVLTNMGPKGQDCSSSPGSPLGTVSCFVPRLFADIAVD